MSRQRHEAELRRYLAAVEADSFDEAHWHILGILQIQARLLIRSKEVRDEVISEVSLAYRRHLVTREGRAHLAAVRDHLDYLKRAIKNRYLNAIRGRMRSREHYACALDETSLVGPVIDDPHRHLLDCEDRDLLVDAFKNLTEREAQVIVLCDIEGCSFEEAGRRLSACGSRLQDEAVRSCLRRGRAKLAQFLNRHPSA